MDPRSHALSLGPVILGSWTFEGWSWGGLPRRTALEVVHAALDAGVCAVDTAPLYGFGRAEEILADAPRSLRILTKVGLRWDRPDRGVHFFDTRDASQRALAVRRWLGPEGVREELEGSLRRLRRDHVDLVQAHWPDPTTPPGEVADGLQALVDDGLALAWGVSNFDQAELTGLAPGGPEGAAQPRSEPRRGEDGARGSGRPRRTPEGAPSTLQVRLSLVRREALPTLAWAADRGVVGLVYKALEQGLLLGRDPSQPWGDRRDEQGWFGAANRHLLDGPARTLRAMADDLGATPAQVALAWARQQVGAGAVIVGARSPRQATENASLPHLGAPELDALAAAFDRLALAGAP